MLCTKLHIATITNQRFYKASPHTSLHLLWDIFAYIENLLVAINVWIRTWAHAAPPKRAQYLPYCLLNSHRTGPKHRQHYHRAVIVQSLPKIQIHIGSRYNHFNAFKNSNCRALSFLHCSAQRWLPSRDRIIKWNSIGFDFYCSFILAKLNNEEARKTKPTSKSKAGRFIIP